MKIIQLGNIIEPITVDSTMYTVDDNIYITVDLSQIGSNYSVIKFMPRFFPELTDVLTVKFRDELTNEVFTPEYTFDYTDNYFNLRVLSEDFVNATKYEFEVFLDEQYIYKGKAIALTKGVDEIQNYSLVNKTNNKLKF